MSSRDRVTANDADYDSDTDSPSDPQLRRKTTPKRSATVSPAARQRFRHGNKSHRRRSDVYLSTADCRGLHGSAKNRMSSERLHMYSSFEEPLRKTNSEPSVEQQQQALTLDAIRQILDAYHPPSNKPVELGSTSRINSRGVTPNRQPPRIHSKAADVGIMEVWATPRQSIVSDDSEDDMMNTDIEELRDAVESIQSLQRVLKIPNGSPPSDEMQPHPGLLTPSDSTSTLKGITTNLGGHPRGVMQFLPSAKNNQFQPTLDSYTWNKNHNTGPLTRRKASVPENYLKYSGSTNSDRSSPRPRPTMRIIRPSDTEPELYSSSSTISNKGVDSIAGVNRFSKLLNSLRSSRQNLLMPPEPTGAQRQIQQSLLQADQLLWKRRSRASLRRHQDIRNMAVRELFDTERGFVDCLETLVQKYMRPLKQPLECTLIDADLVDKIFYKIPEILAHHQVLYAALAARMECTQHDFIIGDVLLNHFTKQSMIETYMAFVDNFKYAKQTIWEARQRQAFEKYYMRCSREHRAKLDLDSLLILPIQRIPRYELILKQVLKHTPVEHCDYERLMHVQSHVHRLAMAINSQREEKEKMEQRLREIEAIVDGLDDLVSPGRTFNRYDVITVRDSQNVKKQRCIFMMSDQLIVTSISRKLAIRGSSRYQYTQSPDFLDHNRFKLLIKISMYDVEIGQDTIPLLQNVEQQLRNAQEDVNIVAKIIDLSKLLKTDHDSLSDILETMYTERSQLLKALREQMTSNPDLTTVHLQVTTFDGIETFTIQFANAEKRALWENAFLEAKNALKNTMHSEQSPPVLKTILVHRVRQGLILNSATPTFSKSPETPPNIWMCSSDRFSGQVAILNVAGEPSVESTSSMGNSTIKAICAVPALRRRRIPPKKYDRRKSGSIEMELDSSSSEVEASDSEASPTTHSTVWIGNEDGEIFILNYLDNVRLKAREKMLRLHSPVNAIAYVEEHVFVALGTKTQNQLICFERTKDNLWDVDNPKTVAVQLPSKISCMTVVTNWLCFGASNNIYLLNPYTRVIEKSATVSQSQNENIDTMTSLGSIIFVVMENSTTVRLLNAFTLECLSEFSVATTLHKTLQCKEDIIRNHKTSTLRITALLCARNQLWIGTSAGIILNTGVCRTKGHNWSPNLSVCSLGHIGPCRFLTSVSVSSIASAVNINKRRMSLNASSLQQFDQIYIISGGNGVDNFVEGNANDETGVDDACNHLIFWQI
uniref:DH domain-containing protein n=1 Tax=Panagrellus redivivus TaxID=6233 RepID=A0A7E4VUP9_PANRE